jgi:hypothetical protein
MARIPRKVKTSNVVRMPKARIGSVVPKLKGRVARPVDARVFARNK